MTAASAVLTIVTDVANQIGLSAAAHRPFEAGDVGATVRVFDGGPKSAHHILESTIASVESSVAVTLAAAATFTVSRVRCEILLAASAITLAAVSGSAGDYKGTLPKNLPLVDGRVYAIEYQADLTDGTRSIQRRIDRAAYAFVRP